MDNIYTMQYYLVIKKNKIISFAEKRIEVEITLSEIIQMKKYKCSVFSLICKIHIKT
jgi:hypothetical protein